MNRRLAVLLVLLLLPACRKENMATQPKNVTWGTSSFLPRGMTMQKPPADTVAQNPPDRPAAQPPRITAAMLARGQHVYDENCVPCHDFAGTAHGMVVSRGFPPPPPYTSSEVTNASAVELYAVISNGKGAMFGFGDRIVPSDRWAIIAYIRALELSQNANIASLPAQDRAQLAKAQP